MDSFGFTPKPRVAAYTSVLRQAGIHAGNCIMVEDSAANLKTAKRLGMRTAWLSQQCRKPSWVDWRITSLFDLQRI
jgi:putative hydrolase of the HAD superfamily